MQNEYGDLESALKRKAENQQKAAQAKLEQQLSANGRLRSGTTARLVAQSNAGIESGLQDQIGSLEKEGADKAREERLIQEQEAFQSKESALNRGLGERQLGEQARQFNAEFQENTRTNLFNKLIALKDFDSGKLVQIGQMLGLDLGQVQGVIGKMTDIPGTGSAPITSSTPGAKAGAASGVPAGPSSYKSFVAGELANGKRINIGMLAKELGDTSMLNQMEPAINSVIAGLRDPKLKVQNQDRLRLIQEALTNSKTTQLQKSKQILSALKGIRGIY